MEGGIDNHQRSKGRSKSKSNKQNIKYRRLIGAEKQKGNIWNNFFWGVGRPPPLLPRPPPKKKNTEGIAGRETMTPIYMCIGNK